MVPDSILARIPAFVRRKRCAPIGGLPHHPTGYFTGRVVVQTEDLRTALHHLSKAGCSFFVADGALLVAALREDMIVRRFHPGPSMLLRRAFGRGNALLEALDAAGIQDGDMLDGDPSSAHRRLHLEAVLAHAPVAARAAWDNIARVRAACPQALRPLRFRREGRFRWIAEDGPSIPWVLDEVADPSFREVDCPP